MKKIIEIKQLFGFSILIGSSVIIVNSNDNNIIKTTEKIKLIATYPLIIAPLSKLNNIISDIVLEKITLEEFKYMNKNNILILKNYCFNKRFMVYDILVNNIIFQYLNYFLLFNISKNILNINNDINMLEHSKKICKIILDIAVINIIIEMSFGYYYHKHMELNKKILSLKIINRFLWHYLIWFNIFNANNNNK